MKDLFIVRDVPGGLEIGMAAFFIVVLLLKLAVAIHMIRIRKGVENMQFTKNHLCRNVKKQYEKQMLLGKQMKNTEAFIKNTVCRHRFLGLKLVQWKRLASAAAVVLFLTGFLTGVYGIFMKQAEQSLPVVLTGVGLGGILVIFNAISSMDGFMEETVVGMLCFLDNQYRIAPLASKTETAARMEETWTREPRTGENWTREPRKGETWTREPRTGETWTGEPRKGETWTREPRTGEVWMGDPMVMETAETETKVSASNVCDAYSENEKRLVDEFMTRFLSSDSGIKQ